MSEQGETTDDEGPDVINVTEAATLLAESLRDDAMVEALGPPEAVAIVAVWKDGTVGNWGAGPAYSEELHMQMLGYAGRLLFNKLAAEKPPEPLIHVPPSIIIPPH